MMRLRKTAGLATAALLAGGLALGSAQGARAAAPEPASWGAANLLSAADSDFETGITGWQAVTNTTVAQDAATAFHGTDSLKLTATAAGSQQAKAQMGGNQVSLTGGATYRISSWVKTGSAVSGRTVTFALGTYDATPTWQGWSSGPAVTLASTAGWQYVSGLITVPATADHTLGSPRITEAGVIAGEKLNVDEVLYEPYRASTMIGAKDPSTDGSAWASMNSAIGPAQVDKMFYSGALPSTYGASNCGVFQSTHAGVTCVQAYKTPDTNVAAYVASIPAGRNVILVFHQEPEGDTFANGPDGCSTGTDAGNFVCEFKAQAALVRGAVTATNRANVWISDDSSGFNYGTGRTGASCAWTVPGTSTDMYFMDHYENPADGSNSATYGTPGQHSEFTNWIGCIGPQGKPIGFGEYGLNCPTTGTPNALTTSQAMAADNTLLEGETFTGTTGGAGGTTYVRPVADWMYWWYDNAGACEFTTGGSPAGTQAVQQWQANETQNGGGAS